MIERILVAVDGSEHSGRALDLAADLAARYGAEMDVVHVMTRIGGGRVPEGLEEFGRLEHVYITEANLLRSAAEDIVERAAERGRRGGVSRVGTTVEVGDPATRIVGMAKEMGADLIVMGSRGLGSFTGLLLGSTSHKVAHLSECAVLTVR